MKIAINNIGKNSFILSLFIFSLVSNVGFSADNKVKDPNKPTTIKHPSRGGEKAIKPGTAPSGRKPFIIPNPQPIKSNLQPIKTKEYKVPGVMLIAAAKRHGYYFDVGSDYKQRGCRFMGMHWYLPAGVGACEIIGFASNIPKCKLLRKGWTIGGLKLTNFDKKYQETNSYALPGGPDPLILLWPRGTKKAVSIILKSAILVGPEGPFNKFEEAFSHCDDASYRP